MGCLNSIYKLGANGQYVLNQTIALSDCLMSYTVTISDDGLWLVSGVYSTSGAALLFVFSNDGNQFNSV